MVNYHHLFQLIENKKLFKETRFLNLEFSKTSFWYRNCASIITTPVEKKHNLHINILLLLSWEK